MPCPKLFKHFKRGVVFSLATLLFPLSNAHAQEATQYSTLEETVSSLSVNIVLIGSVILVLLAVIALSRKNLNNQAKKLVFISFAFVSISVTLFLAISTVYVNLISHSKGPVHYHADFEIHACGQELNIEDPVGLSNKIGTPTLHEHNDFRIHLEGVVVVPEDQSIGKFFDVIGGSISNIGFSVPTDNGLESFTNGSTCPDGTTGTVQAFVYRTVGEEYYQEKLDNIPNYLYAREQSVPPGDCIIIEFGPEKTQTDHICTSYEVAEEIGKIRRRQ